MSALHPDHPPTEPSTGDQAPHDQPTGEHRHGPPWLRHGAWGPGHHGPPRFSHEGWQRRHGGRSGWLFLRFVLTFGLLAIVALAGLALLTIVVVRLAGGDRRAAAVLWLSTCGLLLLFPLLTGVIGRRAFRGIAAPLASLMEGAERVAAGDLTVRLPAAGRGEFEQLIGAFNHMVEELALADGRRRNLTADVAHELRTPLQIIQGNLEGILDGVYQPTPEHLEATLGETRLLARLVEDLRVLSQAEAGQLPMQWETVDVAELLVDAATSFSGQAQAAGISLGIEVAGQQLQLELNGSETGSETGSSSMNGAPANPGASAPRLAVWADYGRLAQVLGNLLANALRHTPAGGFVTLAAVSIPATPANAADLQIRVIDTGEGIAPADLPFVFDRFWRADRARPHASGSGLGLAIARQLVQAHGGTISVASTPGQGTTFTIELKSSDVHM